MARKALLLATAFVLSLLALTGCNNDNGNDAGTGDSYQAPAATETSSPDTSGSDTAAACESASPGSSAQENCEAQGVPGTTENADRCGATTPSPIASGIIQGTFGSWCDNAIASTYNTTAVPDGADTTVTITETDANTTLEMIARGFMPNTAFAATLHDSLCGAEPSAAGAEYNNEGSQPENLILDFTTDESGKATAAVTVPWLVPDDGIGRSLVVTAGSSSMKPGKENTDTAVACVSLER